MAIRANDKLAAGGATATPNGSDKPVSEIAGAVTQRATRLQRTLLFAGLFTVLAMVFVPMPKPHDGYRFIFDTSDTRIAFFQLLVNVAFAAGVGAIVAQLSKRALVVIALGIVLLVGAAGELAFVKYSWVRAEEDERNGYARQAVLNWRYALQFDKAAGVETRIAERERREKFEEARQRFLEEWQRNARRVIVFHPEVGQTNSPIRRRVDALISTDVVYSQRVDGFELAYQAALKESPSPPPIATTQDQTSDRPGDRRIAEISAPLNVEVQMRSEHHSRSASVISLHRGDRVFVEAERFQNNDPPVAATWQKVTTMSGQSGWVNAEYLSPTQ